MSVWKDEDDFMKDIESVSVFFVSGDHNNKDNKFEFKSKTVKKPVNTPWYESDSEEELDYSALGNGRNGSDNTNNSDPEPNHLEIMREIQSQVRSTVGNRYNNEVLESYFNVYKNEDDPDLNTESRAPKEVSISYAKEQDRLKHSRDGTPPIPKKMSIAKNIQNSVQFKERNSQDPSASTSSSHSRSNSSSPRRPSTNGNNSKRRYESRTNNHRSRQDYSSNEYQININSKSEFPPL